jgi:hypothetical protein
MPEMTMNQYAKYRKVSHAAVQHALSAGRIKVCRTEKRGSRIFSFIQSGEADQSWTNNTDPGALRIQTRGDMEKNSKKVLEKHFKTIQQREPWEHGLLPAGICEKQFEQICSMSEIEHVGNALTVVAEICKALGVGKSPNIKSQTDVFLKTIKAMDEADRIIAALEIVERVTGRMVEALDPDEKYNPSKEWQA